ncbi:hypothetical protein B0H14DRAFT_3608238 [Mycena olivaceomarginata]|nr:hypothetical protein B0H14DRAFT_3608238 [Mycena olivaceomarginata]
MAEKADLVKPCDLCGLVPSYHLPPLNPLPPTHPLFTQNDPPSDSDVHRIQDFLASAKEHVDCLDMKIKALAAIMSSLVAERDSVAKEMRVHEGMISPIRRLPTEIISRILPMTLRPLAPLQCPEVPWYLGQITRRWRDIAIALPVLWTAFTLRPLPSQESALDRFNQRFHEQFRRSTNAPLHIIAQIPARKAEGALSTLLDACERWETISNFVAKCLCCGGYISRGHIRVPSPSNFPPLSLTSWILRTTAFTTPPKLSQSIDWQHLTRYDGLVQWSTHLDILRQATCLAECRMIFQVRRDESTDDPLTNQRLFLPNLRRLSVSTTLSLQYIVAPGLQEFALDANLILGTDGPKSGEAQHIIDFFRRSSCTLFRLSLFRFASTLSLLQSVPNLTELTIEGEHTDTMISLVQDLFPVEELGDDAIPLLANLTAITLGGSHFDVLPLQPAVQMISARFSPPKCYKPLRFFGLLLDTGGSAVGSIRYRHTNTIERLAALRAAGLEFCVAKCESQYNKIRTSDPYSIRRCAEYYNERLTRRHWQYT